MYPLCHWSSKCSLPLYNATNQNSISVFFSLHIPLSISSLYPSLYIPLSLSVLLSPILLSFYPLSLSFFLPILSPYSSLFVLFTPPILLFPCPSLPISLILSLPVLFFLSFSPYPSLSLSLSL